MGKQASVFAIGPGGRRALLLPLWSAQSAFDVCLPLIIYLSSMEPALGCLAEQGTAVERRCRSELNFTEGEERKGDRREKERVGERLSSLFGFPYSQKGRWLFSQSPPRMQKIQASALRLAFFFPSLPFWQPKVLSGSVVNNRLRWRHLLINDQPFKD